MGKVNFYKQGTIEHFEYHIADWSENLKIYEVNINDAIYKEDMWQVLVRTHNKIIVVSDTQDIELTESIKEITKEEFMVILKTYEDDSFIIYHKQLDSRLIGYLIDFFEYSIKLPNKIKSFENENIKFFEKLNKKYY